MRGRWAAGIVPRNFSWILEDHLAIAERPGGHAPNHRKVRRQEEILWIKAQGFTRVISLMSSPHNLYVYDEFQLPFIHIPLSPNADLKIFLPELYAMFSSWMENGDKVLVHNEDVSDQLVGIMAGYLLWTGLLPSGPQAIAVTERLVSRKMGSNGRSIVAIVTNFAPPETPLKIKSSTNSIR